MQRFITTWTLLITFRSADPHFRTAIEALLTGIEPESLSEAIRQVCYVLEVVGVMEHLRSSHDEARMGNETYRGLDTTYGFLCAARFQFLGTAPLRITKKKRQRQS